MTKIDEFEFDHDLFDAEFLLNMRDHGINISEYEYERLRDDPKWTVSRQFGDNYFAFEFDQGHDMKDVEKMAAKRAAYRMRDKLQPWYHEAAIWIEDKLDQLYGT